MDMWKSVLLQMESSFKDCMIVGSISPFQRNRINRRGRQGWGGGGWERERGKSEIYYKEMVHGIMEAEVSRFAVGKLETSRELMVQSQSEFCRPFLKGLRTRRTDPESSDRRKPLSQLEDIKTRRVNSPLFCLFVLLIPLTDWMELTHIGRAICFT